MRDGLNIDGLLSFIKLIATDIWQKMPYLFPGVLVGGVGALLIYLISGSFRHKISIDKLRFNFLFVCYVTVLAYITLFSREPRNKGVIDLIPFYTVGKSLLSWRYFVENVILFIPFGLLWFGVTGKSRKWVRNFSVVLGSSLCIEILQAITGRGVFHMDDLIANVLGGIIGLLIVSVSGHLE